MRILIFVTFISNKSQSFGPFITEQLNCIFLQFVCILNSILEIFLQTERSSKSCYTLVGVFLFYILYIQFILN